MASIMATLGIYWLFTTLSAALQVYNAIRIGRKSCQSDYQAYCALTALGVYTLPFFFTVYLGQAQDDQEWVPEDAKDAWSALWLLLGFVAATFLGVPALVVTGLSILPQAVTGKRTPPRMDPFREGTILSKAHKLASSVQCGSFDRTRTSHSRESTREFFARFSTELEELHSMESEKGPLVYLSQEAIDLLIVDGLRRRERGAEWLLPICEQYTIVGCGSGPILSIAELIDMAEEEERKPGLERATYAGTPSRKCRLGSFIFSTIVLPWLTCGAINSFMLWYSSGH